MFTDVRLLPRPTGTAEPVTTGFCTLTVSGSVTGKAGDGSVADGVGGADGATYVSVASCWEASVSFVTRCQGGGVETTTGSSAAGAAGAVDAVAPSETVFSSAGAAGAGAGAGV